MESLKRTSASFLARLNSWNPWILRRAIKTHRAQKADDRCIEDDDRLYAVLADGIKCDRRVGDKAAMLRNCDRFIDRRCQSGGWRSYAELEVEIRRLKKSLWLDASSAWPLVDVLGALVNWCTHLHDLHNCDCDGYEGRMAAVAAARNYVLALLMTTATSTKRCDVCRKGIVDGGYLFAEAVSIDLCSTECFLIYSERN